ncbi:hypothetical protein [Pseudomonas sp. A-B-19]|uniref:hypothetical protein n=1 Tax=Pseudomonas sp. A-B-19 TaxID=2832405 RepID=UPI001CBB4971|nr:hypothetical protein [Pseudomonas sp. A-B-19]
MPNKSLRILIADAQHFNRLRIERLFNQLGYFRVAPVAGKVRVSQAALPDLASITQLMSAVDHRLPFVGTVISVR